MSDTALHPVPVFLALFVSAAFGFLLLGPLGAGLLGLLGLALLVMTSRDVSE